MLRVRDGQLEVEPWVYAWVGPDGVVSVCGPLPAEPSARADELVGAVEEHLRR